MSYHELLFIKAEVLARRGDTLGAKAALNDAVIAAYEAFNVMIDAASEHPLFGMAAHPLIFTESLSATEAQDYFDNRLSALCDVNPLREIMIEKYLSCFGAGGELLVAYNDYRRMQYLGENFIQLDNPRNSNRFPQRFAYGADDVNNNSNIKTACGNGQYVYTEKVWWAGGTR